MTYKPVELFSPVILKDHIAILGKTGSGKTSTGKLLVEQVAGSDRVCILDTVKSDWWGLTSSADGKKAGLPFHILGGPRGHVPLHSGAGAAIAKLVASGDLRHSIIDMADFEAGGVQRFFCDFAPALMRHQRGVLYLVIEEAHELAPKERAGFGSENMSIHWAKKLATAGRSKGIRLIVLTQSVQQLHNRVLGSCETMIAHRLTAPADQKPVVDWLKSNVPDKARAKEIAASLSSLRTGTGWLCAGEAQQFERREFPRIRTFDNSATPTSDDAAQSVKQATVDTAALRAAIGLVVAEAEADDPKRLRARIAELEAQARKAPAAAAPVQPDPQALEHARQTGYAEGHRDARSAVSAALNPGLHVASLSAAREALESSAKALASAIVGTAPSRYVPPEPKPAVRAVPRASGPGDQSLPAGERAVLTCAAQYGGVERDQLSVLTGYKKSSRDAYIARLREKNLIAIDRLTIMPTEAGMQALGKDFEPMPTGADLLAFWRNKLPRGECAVLDVLVQHGSKAVSRLVIDDSTGYKKSSRDAYLSRLEARRLIETVRAGEVRASPTLFSS